MTSLAPADLHGHVGRRHAHQIADHRAFVFDVFLFLAPLHFEQRWLCDIDVSLLNQLGHLTIEESEQQRSDVGTVDVGVGHQNDLVIAKLAGIEIFFPDAGSERHDQRLDFAVAQHLVEARLLDIENLSLERKNRLVLPVASLLG